MILRTRYGGDRELRLFESTSDLPRRGSVSMPVANQPALMVACVAAAVRLISESIGGFIPRVYENDGPDRQPVMGIWQADLFQNPGAGRTSFDFWSDVSSSLELYKFALVLKRPSMSTAQIVELEVIPPDWAMIDVNPDTGERRIKVYIGGRVMDVTSRVIFIRAWSPDGSEGVSTTALHARQLRTANEFETFRGAYFQHGGQPTVVISHPGNPTDEQKEALLDSWVARHGSAQNAHRPGLVYGGAEVTALPATMRDAQGSETAVQVVQDVARMFRIYPAELLHTSLAGGGSGVGDQWADLFARFSLFPRMRRIERAISADPDLFPQRRRYMRFDASDFTRANVDTLADVAHQLVQVGVLTANEARAMMGIAKSEDPAADELQATPVGGAPNEGAPEPTENDDEGEPE